MRKKRKIAWIIAAALIVIGALTAVGALAKVKFDFTALGTKRFVQTAKEVEEDFAHIEVNVRTTDITFVRSEEGTTKIECFEDEKERHSITVEDNTLYITQEKAENRMEHFAFSPLSSKITVYLPDRAYESLTVTAVTGDFACENLAFAEISFAEKTGDITLSDMDCRNFISTSSTGNVTLTNVIAQEGFAIQASTGNIRLEDCDADTVTVQTSTGNVSGSFLTGKTFDVKTSTGDVVIPEGSVGGKCEIKTGTGNIHIKVRR